MNCNYYFYKAVVLRHYLHQKVKFKFKELFYIRHFPNTINKIQYTRWATY